MAGGKPAAQAKAKRRIGRNGKPVKNQSTGRIFTNHGQKEHIPYYKQTFLAAIRKGQSVYAAAAAADISRNTAYHWRWSDPEFAAAWDEAKQDGIDLMVDEARRRAVEGVEEAVYHAGDVVGHKINYSDRLLEFLLKGMRPEVFNPATNLSITDQSSTTQTREQIEKRLTSLGLPLVAFDEDEPEDVVIEGTAVDITKDEPE